MGDHDRQAQNNSAAPPPQPAPPAPMPADAPLFQGPGVAELGRLLAQHNPPAVMDVVGLLRRHPHDRDAIYAVLRRECPSIVGQVVVQDTMLNPGAVGALAPRAIQPAVPGAPGLPGLAGLGGGGTPHPAPPRPATEGGGESPLTAEGNNNELTVGVEGSARRGNTTVTGNAGVTVGREEGQAGVTSGQVGGNVSHTAGPVTMEVGLSLAHRAGGRVTIEGQGSIVIDLTRWAQLRVEGKIDNEGNATASAGLTIDLLRAFGVRGPGGLGVSLTAGTSVDQNGVGTGNVGIQIRIPGT